MEEGKKRGSWRCEWEQEQQQRATDLNLKHYSLQQVQASHALPTAARELYSHKGDSERERGT